MKQIVYKVKLHIHDVQQVYFLILQLTCPII
jgi:hypothetical protein